MTDIAPTPYTIEQIREGNPPGRWRTFRIEAEGHEPFLRRTTFVEVDDEGATLESVHVDEAGEPVGPSGSGKATWEMMRGHAAYSAERTQIAASPVEVEVAGGRFRCKHYTVTEETPDGREVSQAWFALEDAGPPVKLVVERDGERVLYQELVARG